MRAYPLDRHPLVGQICHAHSNDATTTKKIEKNYQNDIETNGSLRSSQIIEVYPP
jgi:hypothetical protein